jgi:hypothetical protein
MACTLRATAPRGGACGPRRAARCLLMCRSGARGRWWWSGRRRRRDGVQRHSLHAPRAPPSRRAPKTQSCDASSLLPSSLASSPRILACVLRWPTSTAYFCAASHTLHIHCAALADSSCTVPPLVSRSHDPRTSGPGRAPHRGARRIAARARRVRARRRRRRRGARAACRGARQPRGERRGAARRDPGRRPPAERGAARR